MKRVVTIGCSGSGKSTLANIVGQHFSLYVVDLDNLRYSGGHKMSSDEFMKAVKKVAAGDDWIVEGMYYKHGIEKVLWSQADLVIWLDLSLNLMRYRILIRSLSRIIKRSQKPYAKKVSFKSEFGKNSLIRLLPKIHKATRKYYPVLLKNINENVEIVRIQNTSDLKTLLNKMEIK